MAETTRKTKAPAKAKTAVTRTTKTTKAETKPAAASKAAAKKPTVAEQVSAAAVTHEEIAHLARKYWAERGHHDGQHEQDWLRAERELQGKAS